MKKIYFAAVLFCLFATACNDGMDATTAREFEQQKQKDTAKVVKGPAIKK